MYPRVNYEMSEKDFETLLDACKPTPCIKIGNYTPATPQENANRAWQSLGDRMGFQWDTVAPIEGKTARFFTAVPTESESQKAERVAREQEDARQAEITKLETEILECQQRLALLKTKPTP